MFCGNCGKKIPDEAKFCPLCGAKIQSFQTENNGQSPNPPVTPDPETAEPGEPKETHRKRGLIALIIIIIIAAAVVVLLLLNMRYGFLNGRSSSITADETAIMEETEAGEPEVLTVTTVEPDEYVSVEFEGIDGYGTAEVTFDFSAMGECYGEDITLSDQAGEKGYLFFSDVLEDTVSVSVDPDSGLSDGDEVTVTLNVDSEAVDELVSGTVEFLDTEVEVTVSGLTPVENFDAFSDVTVTFTGISPDAAASVAVGESELDADAYSLDKSSDLMIGDTVTVSIDEKAAKALEEKEGIYPEKLSKDYTVEGIAYAATSTDQIPDEAMERMEEKAMQIKQDKADTWDPERYELQSIEYVGSYLLSRKPGADVEDDDLIYMVYKLDAVMFGKNEDGSDANVDFTYYWYGCFRNGIIQEDGTFTIDYDDVTQPADIEEEQIIVCSYDYTKKNVEEQENSEVFEGYADLESMFDYIVEPRLDYYDCESTIVD